MLFDQTRPFFLCPCATHAGWQDRQHACMHACTTRPFPSLSLQSTQPQQSSAPRAPFFTSLLFTSKHWRKSVSICVPIKDGVASLVAMWKATAASSDLWFNTLLYMSDTSRGSWMDEGMDE